MDIEIFKNNEFGEIRGLVIDDEPYFVAKDVAAALGYKDTNNAVKQHCRGVVKCHPIKDRLERTQEVRVIMESDIYRLVIGSKLPEAEKFEAWVFEEVLPSIRKHGAFLTDKTIEDVLTDPDTLIRLAQDLKKEKAKRREIEMAHKKMKPKADYADAVIGVSNTVSFRDWIATLKSDHGLKVGERKVLKMLMEKKILYRTYPANELRAYSEYAKYFTLVPVVTTTPKGSKQHMQLKVTGLGQVKVGERVVKYFMKREE